MSSIKEYLADSDAVLIGAGAGLSTAAGLAYSGPVFEKEFKEYIDKYNFTDLYTSSFYPFQTEEERWAYWSKHVMYARILPPALPLYKKLFQIVENENYFVITTNVDGQFRKAGFDINRIFEVQGDYAYIQSAFGTDHVRFNAEQLFKEMYEKQYDCRIPKSLVPRYYNGKIVFDFGSESYDTNVSEPMDINIRKDQYFVEDATWQRQRRNYTDFINVNVMRKLVLLELGVGFNTPTIIRYPFEQMAKKFPQITLIRVNLEHPEADGEEPNLFFGLKDINELFND